MMQITLQRRIFTVGNWFSYLPVAVRVIPVADVYRTFVFQVVRS
jgi:hypothetical protein